MATVFRGPVPPVQITKGNFVSYLFNEADTWNHLPALVCDETERTITYADLRLQIGRWGSWLNQREGFKASTTVVGVLTGVCVDMVVLQLGTMAHGGIFTVIEENCHPNEMANQLEMANVELLAVAEKYDELVKEAFICLGRSIPVIVVGKNTGIGISFYDIVQDSSLTVRHMTQLSGEEAAYIVFTSGTTGVPKCLAWSHKSIIYSLEQLVHPSLCSTPKPTEGEQFKILQTRNFGLAYGFICCLLPSVKVGACQVVKEEDEQTLLEDIEKYKINKMHIVPPTLVTLLRIPKERPKVLSHFCRLFVAGAPTPIVHEEAVKRTMPNMRIQQCYGMSEVSAISVDPVTGGKPGYTGQIVPNTEIKVLDINTKQPLPAMENGLIYVRSSTLMIGYLNNLEATKAVVDSDGWFTTGDIGHVDHDCFMKITDREKDIIVGQSAINVSPSELENALLKDPLLTGACVVGVMQPLTGIDDIVAFVSATDQRVTEEYVKEVVNLNLNERKHLNKAVVVKTLPKNNNGKIDRKALRMKAQDLYNI